MTVMMKIAIISFLFTFQLLIRSMLMKKKEIKSINISSSRNNSDKNVPFTGVNVRGFYTSIQYDTDRYPHAPPFPAEYYENIFRLISQAGMNHVRFIFYWEAYEKN